MMIMIEEDNTVDVFQYLNYSNYRILLTNKKWSSMLIAGAGHGLVLFYIQYKINPFPPFVWVFIARFDRFHLDLNKL